MYSAADSVLKYLFTTGQKLAGEPGDPVGLKGEPKKMWNLSLSMDNYGHGEYWGSKDVAQTIAHWLGAPAPYIIFSRQPTTRPPAISRELGSYREISAILKLNHWRSQ